MIGQLTTLHRVGEQMLLAKVTLKQANAPRALHFDAAHIATV